MPIYEYRCAACGHTLDALQKISDEPLTDCPECDEAELKRLISAPNFRLKGRGWYETDFKSEKEKKRNLAGEADKPKSDDSRSSDKQAGDKKTGSGKSDSGKAGSNGGASKSKETAAKSSSSKGEAA